MPFCPKCGAKVDEGVAFCPNCGTSLKGEPARTSREDWRESRREWRAQRRERRRAEKGEKYEKREYGFVGSMIGGTILILLGFLLYLQILGYPVWQYTWAAILIVVGAIIIIGAIYAGSLARRRQPPA